jgi:hypothetical protein
MRRWWCEDDDERLGHYDTVARSPSDDEVGEWPMRRSKAQKMNVAALFTVNLRVSKRESRLIDRSVIDALTVTSPLTPPHAAVRRITIEVCRSYDRPMWRPLCAIALNHIYDAINK